jgi:hypothetical protein
MMRTRSTSSVGRRKTVGFLIQLWSMDLKLLLMKGRVSLHVHSAKQAMTHRSVFTTKSQMAISKSWSTQVALHLAASMTLANPSTEDGEWVKGHCFLIAGLPGTRISSYCYKDVNEGKERQCITYVVFSMCQLLTNHLLVSRVYYQDKQDVLRQMGYWGSIQSSDKWVPQLTVTGLPLCGGVASLKIQGGTDAENRLVYVARKDGKETIREMGWKQALSEWHCLTDSFGNIIPRTNLAMDAYYSPDGKSRTFSVLAQEPSDDGNGTKIVQWVAHDQEAWVKAFSLPLEYD